MQLLHPEPITPITPIFPHYIPDLDALLRLPRLPQLHNFFLQSDTTSELSALCTPSVLDASWATSLQVDAQSVTQPSTNIVSKSWSVLLVPAHAIATSQLTAGVCVYSDDSTGQVSIGRFARDDSDGTITFVLNNSDGVHVDVLTTSHDGAMRVRRIFGRFRGVQSFRSALSGDSSNNGCNSGLARCMVNFESRACPMCQRRGERPCTCRLAFISPMHAADFATFRANMHALTGSYAGHCYRVTSVPVPGIAQPEEMVSRTQVIPSNSQPLITSLANTAVQMLLANGPVYQDTLPIEPLTPQATAQATVQTATSSTMTASTVPTTHSTTPTPKSASALSFAESVESIIQQSFTVSNADTSRDVLENDPLAAFLSGTVPSTSTTCIEQSLQTSPLSQLGQGLPSGVPAAPVSYSSTWPLPSHAHSMQLGESFQENGSYTLGAPARAASPTASNVSSASSAAVTAAPLPASKAISAPARRPRRTTKKVMTEEMLREREARRQLRVFKNRQAAARSNLRRKLQNDRLKSALAEVRGKALELRDQHMILREENLKLKLLILGSEPYNANTNVNTPSTIVNKLQVSN